ncbi:MAG: hypothetical protein QOE22_354 [Candidatus Parcubacteria bacterium]|jgi:hypothetical protein|nr:hypothetical protein [Candidatus Parcubacteria bacterium]
MHLSRKNLLTIICAVVVLLGGFYYFFFVARSSDETVLSADAPATEAELSFITLVSQLDPIEFDARILDDQRFRNLVDIRTEVVPEPQGRTDPFGPLGS